MHEKINQLNTQFLSTHAKVIIENKSKSNSIIYVKEYLSHDGYNRFGPESNLWDLYVYIKNEKTNEIIIYNYHWEDWFYHKIKSHYGYGKKPYQIIDKMNWQYKELIKKIKN